MGYPQEVGRTVDCANESARHLGLAEADLTAEGEWSRPRASSPLYGSIADHAAPPSSNALGVWGVAKTGTLLDPYPG